MTRSLGLLMLAGTPLVYKALPVNISKNTMLDIIRQGKKKCRLS